MSRDTAVYGGGPRPGRDECECHFGPSPVHGHHLVQRRGVLSYPDECIRYGTMHDGWFICGPCTRHAPQLRGTHWNRAKAT